MAKIETIERKYNIYGFASYSEAPADTSIPDVIKSIALQKQQALYHAEITRLQARLAAAKKAEAEACTQDPVAVGLQALADSGDHPLAVISDVRYLNRDTRVAYGVTIAPRAKFQQGTAVVDIVPAAAIVSLASDHKNWTHYKDCLRLFVAGTNGAAYPSRFETGYGQICLGTTTLSDVEMNEWFPGADEKRALAYMRGSQYYRPKVGNATTIHIGLLIGKAIADNKPSALVDVLVAVIYGGGYRDEGANPYGLYMPAPHPAAMTNMRCTDKAVDAVRRRFEKKPRKKDEAAAPAAGEAYAGHPLGPFVIPDEVAQVAAAQAAELANAQYDYQRNNEAVEEAPRGEEAQQQAEQGERAAAALAEGAEAAGEGGEVARGAGEDRRAEAAPQGHDEGGEGGAVPRNDNP